MWDNFVVFIATDQIVCGMDEIFQKKKKKRCGVGNWGWSEIHLSARFMNMLQYI